MEFKYGVPDHYADITSKVVSFLEETGSFTIPAEEYYRVSFFGDPCYGVVNTLFTKYGVNPIT